MFPSVCLEKKYSNKVFIGLCGGKVCCFSRDPDTCSMAKLSQQHFHPSFTRGYCGCIPLPLSATTTRKNNKSIERSQRKREKTEKSRSPPSCFPLFTLTCFPNNTFPYFIKLGGMP
jgi:hypothetical protein